MCDISSNLSTTLRMFNNISRTILFFIIELSGFTVLFPFFRIFNAIIGIKLYFCGNINSEPIIQIHPSQFFVL